MGPAGTLTLTLLYDTNTLKRASSVNLLPYPLFAMTYLYILSFKGFQPAQKKKGEKFSVLTKGRPVAPGVIVGDVQVCRRNQFGAVPVELSLSPKKKTPQQFRV